MLIHDTEQSCLYIGLGFLCFSLVRFVPRQCRGGEARAATEGTHKGGVRLDKPVINLFFRTGFSNRYGLSWSTSLKGHLLSASDDHVCWPKFFQYFFISSLFYRLSVFGTSQLPLRYIHSIVIISLLSPIAYYC